ncbi:MAG: hypothetical protein A2806_01235 [Candidatus Terrybacteria bacterium RIFCSPHIGHO2_01_FULL_48_17]|uniref:YdbS-like PH domain-containing protein n=1 Tax=Candidatus Terrybacteria bacterium RIFCSPHIGHO2_01_FULL_48_17 TaxID=1802362 RepID=A0A1G2PM72_9BACT|nr:MAG: hypothetical protein A2806_01235 [Candidatus Terrybacteria bacterium RIFCSPHIGHO2_01_FULL_48_17]OHA53410.1 MAG: hypothetical protein A3A30_02715 [Candidatus Terrybacteria bacterium RIFCSPLOWO2_01_FULL_48_14]
MIELHKNEDILAVRRKTWFVFAATWAAALLLLLGPLFGAAILAAPKLEILRGALITPYVFLSGFFEWTVWLWLFAGMINYYYDVFIITNERIVHIEQKGMFNRTVAELNLSRLQDVTIEQRGLVETLLHFGTIRAQTAGELNVFTFEQVDRPEVVKEIIARAQRIALKGNRPWP